MLNGMDLLYTAHVPAGDGPHPTLLLLHGWGASAHDLIGLAPVLHGGRTLVLCPQGPLAFQAGPGMLGYGWFPLVPGTTYVYRGVKDGEPTRDVVHVTSRMRTIDGVRCVAVTDRLYASGRLAERTTDWYAQDRSGTVWYFGEDTAELDRAGRVTSREGSWLAGEDGARAGVFMPARPRVGQAFRQELLKGHAEDRFRVIGVHASVRTPASPSRWSRKALAARAYS